MTYRLWSKSPAGKAKDPVVSPSTRLDIPGAEEVLESCQFLVHTGIWLRIDKLASQSGASRQKARTSFFRVFTWAASRRAGPDLAWGLLTKDPDFSVSSHFKQPTKKTRCQVCPAAWVLLLSNVVKLTAQISHHVSRSLVNTRFERLRRPLVSTKDLVSWEDTRHRHTPVALVMGPRPKELKEVHCPEVAP